MKYKDSLAFFWRVANSIKIMYSIHTGQSQRSAALKQTRGDNMLTVRDLSNPNLLNKRSDIRLRGSLYLKDIDLSVFSSAIHEYTNIVDDEDRIIGSVKT